MNSTDSHQQRLYTAGVYLGCMHNEFPSILSQNKQSVTAFSAVGMSHNFMSGRVSFVLGLQGVSMAVDTACSSSLLAVDLARRGNETHRATSSIAGGVNLMQSPNTSAAICQLQALSHDGRCKTFDSSADGYGRGEAVAAILVSHILELDECLAVVKATSANQDGRGSSLTSPNGVSQVNLILSCVESQGIEHRDIDLVSMHGTGTLLGDPIELNALNKALFVNVQERDVTNLQSSKSQLGHTEGSAGITGLLQALGISRQSSLKPLKHLRKVNPFLFDALDHQMNRKGFHLPRSEAPKPVLNMCLTSSFGMSGTNATAILCPPRSLLEYSDTHRYLLNKIRVAQTPELSEIFQRCRGSADSIYFDVANAHTLSPRFDPENPRACSMQGCGLAALPAIALHVLMQDSSQVYSIQNIQYWISSKHDCVLIRIKLAPRLEDWELSGDGKIFSTGSVSNVMQNTEYTSDHRILRNKRIEFLKILSTSSSSHPSKACIALCLAYGGIQHAVHSIHLAASFALILGRKVNDNCITTSQLIAPPCFHTSHFCLDSRKRQVKSEGLLFTFNGRDGVHLPAGITENLYIPMLSPIRLPRSDNSDKVLFLRPGQPCSPLPIKFTPGLEPGYLEVTWKTAGHGGVTVSSVEHANVLLRYSDISRSVIICDEHSDQDYLSIVPSIYLAAQGIQLPFTITIMAVECSNKCTSKFTYDFIKLKAMVFSMARTLFLERREKHAPSIEAKLSTGQKIDFESLRSSFERKGEYHITLNCSRAYVHRLSKQIALGRQRGTRKVNSECILVMGGTKVRYANINRFAPLYENEIFNCNYV